MESLKIWENSFDEIIESINKQIANFDIMYQDWIDYIDTKIAGGCNCEELS
jgi:hypothetical protein